MYVIQWEFSSGTFDVVIGSTEIQFHPKTEFSVFVIGFAPHENSVP